MHIFVRASKGFNNYTSLERAVNALNFSNTEYYFQGIKSEIDTDGDPVDPISELERLSTEYGSDGSYNIFIIDQKFSDNYFSHEIGRSSIISTDNWVRDFSPPPLHAYYAYQLTQAAVLFSADMTLEQNFAASHYDSIGCCLDHCINKVDIKFGLSAGMLCHLCEGTLKSHNVSDIQIVSIRNMLEQVRKFSIGMSTRIESNCIFLVQRFSEYDENANAMKYGVEAAIRQVGLEPVRGDTDKRPGNLINKVGEYISSCEAVVVKVDEPNLNVYFELGYAAALGKLVFLVCEEGMIKNLPTDLKGWEVVGYKSGDYEGLRDTFLEYLKTFQKFNPKAD